MNANTSSPLKLRSLWRQVSHVVFAARHVVRCVPRASVAGVVLEVEAEAVLAVGAEPLGVLRLDALAAQQRGREQALTAHRQLQLVLNNNFEVLRPFHTKLEHTLRVTSIR